MVGSVVVRDVMVVTRVKILQFDPKGKPLFEMCWSYMVLYGHYPNRFSPLPPLCQMGKRGKSVPNHPGKPLHPWAYIGKKKVLQTILASLKHLPNIEEEGVYLEKGLGTFTHLDKVRVFALLSIRFA